jgi:hypothetical protein
MLGILFWIVVGAFIGWNFPQPAFAKAIQEKLFGKKDS